MRTNRDRVLSVLLAVCCILLAVILAAGAVCIYLDGSSRKTEDPLEAIYTTDAAARVFTIAAPVSAVSAGLLIICILLGVKAPKDRMPPGQDGTAQTAAEPEPKHKGFIRAFILIAAVLLILAGILNGSAMDVFIKAINICTECIGLG